MPGHTIRWYAEPGHVPRNRHMRGASFAGWDAECSCGWGSHTGGSIQERVRDAVAEHRYDACDGPPRPLTRRRRR